MKWLEICINTVSEGIDPLCDRLIALGAEGFTVEDETQLYEFLEKNRAAWDYVDEEFARSMRGVSRVKLYVPQRKEGTALLHAVQRAMPRLRRDRPDVDFGSLEVRTAEVDDEDWGESWKRYYKTIDVGRRMRIRPRWEPSQNTAGRVEMAIDPGMLFGSGTHRTTQLCLEQLEERIGGGESVLDLGCGSGILSVMAILLGAQSVLAVDIDPNAPAVVRANAEPNDITERQLQVAVGNVLEDRALYERLHAGKYHVITANIVADVIIALAPLIPGLLAESGVFIASGIIDTRVREVEEAIGKAGLRILRTVESEGWCAIVSAV